MKGSQTRRERVVWGFLLSAAVACLAPGAALATCTATLPIPTTNPPTVPCYVKVQPIDVGVTVGSTVVYAPFNTTSQTGNPSTAGNGQPTQSILLSGINTPIPNNSTSSNPIGFVVDPSTGLTPGQTGYSGTGIDVTRELLNNIGVELVWLPMAKYPNPGIPDPTNLTITLQPGPSVASGCKGYISGTTLTITSACTSPGFLALNDGVSGSGSAGTIQSGTVITALVSGTGGVGTYTVTPSQTVGSSKSPLTISATSTSPTSQDFLTLTQQDTKVTTPCAISTMTVPLTSPCNTATTRPQPPLSSDPGTINLFFVNKLTPATAGGTLYGFSNICNNGVAIGGNTFFAPTPLQARPDTIAHELLHDLCIDHVTYGAGPYNPYSATTNPNGGILPPFPAKPLPGECDPNYPACAANLMTAGNLRTEPGVVQPVKGGPIYNCVLGLPTAGPGMTACSGQASLLNGLADQVANVVTTKSTSLLPSFASTVSGATPATTGPGGQLPVPQQQEVLVNSASGLLNVNSPQLKFAGLVDPIPYETTKAQLETGGSFADRAIFDLSGPVDGKPGETLVAWVLSLPQEHTFAGQRGLDILSQSRKDLIQDVKYYPDDGNNLPMRNIAYAPGADIHPDDPSPCAATMAQCLVVKFQSPGLRADDSISFAKSILSGGAPIPHDDLCKAKITYMFSDGFMTTSNFGRCPAASRPLIASSWHPDPHVAPQIIKPEETNLLLASLPNPPGTILTGYAYLNNSCAGQVSPPINTTISCLQGSQHYGSPDVTFSVPYPINLACTGAYSGATLCFDSSVPNNTTPPLGSYTLGGFLATGGATILAVSTQNVPNPLAANLNNTVIEFKGTVAVANGQPFTALHDDGLQLMIGSSLVIDAGAPTSAETTMGAYNGPSNTVAFDLVYGECCGPPAVLAVSTVSFPCTLDESTGLCKDPSTTPLPDAVQATEGGQLGQTCDNGKTQGTINVGGTITGPVGGLLVTAGHTCNYSYDFGPNDNCEIMGNLTITGGTVYLDCVLDGTLTVTNGSITISPSAHVLGTTTISQTSGSTVSGFTIGGSNNSSQTHLDGKVTIQNIPLGQNGGSICNTVITSNVIVQNNLGSQIEIGDPADSCPGNSIGGNLTCSGNTPDPISSSNTFPNNGHNNCSG